MLINVSNIQLNHLLSSATVFEGLCARQYDGVVVLLDGGTSGGSVRHMTKTLR